MRKIIFATILCCGCMLNAGWFGLTKDKTPAELEAERVQDEQEIKLCNETVVSELSSCRIILKKYYFLQNTKNEISVLKQYKNIKINMSLMKLTKVDNLIEYMQTVLSEMRRLKKDLEHNKISLEEFSTNINGLIFAWTVPYEILSTKNMYDHSLSGLAPLVYEKIDKKTFINYESFIAKIMPSNIQLYNFGTVPFLNGIYASEAEINSWCQDVKTSLVFDWFHASFSKKFTENINSFFVEEKLNVYDETGHISVIFNKIENKEDLNISSHPVNEKKTIVLNNPFNDEWYMMIREYITIQDGFYKIKKEINNIEDSLSKLDNTEKIVANMKKNLILSDSLYRKLDAIVRYNVIGLPLAIYSDIYSMEIDKVTHFYNDDEKKVAEIALQYNKTCGNMLNYVSNEFTKNKFLQVVKHIKKVLKKEEYHDIVMRAKLSQDWLNMLNKVKVNDK